MKKLTMFICAILLFASPLGAAVIYDNGVPDGENAYRSDYQMPQCLADDFSLNTGASVITDIHWWGVYGLSYTPPQSDDFTILIYNDSAGFPNEVVWSSNVGNNVNRTDTEINIPPPNYEADLFYYWVDVDPVVLAPETIYYLAIVNDTYNDEDDYWFWATSSVDSGEHRTYFEGEWLNHTGELAFNLTSVPEPTTMILLGFGLIGLAGLRRKA